MMYRIFVLRPKKYVGRDIITYVAILTATPSLATCYMSNEPQEQLGGVAAVFGHAAEPHRPTHASRVATGPTDTLTYAHICTHGSAPKGALRQPWLPVCATSRETGEHVEAGEPQPPSSACSHWHKSREE